MAFSNLQTEDSTKAAVAAVSTALVAAKAAAKAVEKTIETTYGWWSKEALPLSRRGITLLERGEISEARSASEELVHMGQYMGASAAEATATAALCIEAAEAAWASAAEASAAEVAYGPLPEEEYLLTGDFTTIYSRIHATIMAARMGERHLFGFPE